MWVAGSLSGDTYPMSQESGSGSVHFKMDGNSSGEAAQDYSVSQGAVPASKSASPHISASVMQLAVVVFTSATSRSVYFGSATPASTGTTQSSPSISTHNVTKVSSSSSTLNVAEFHGYSVALGDADVTSLLGGALPESIAGHIDGFDFKVHQPSGIYTSLGGSRTMTLASGTAAAGTLTHPVNRTSPSAIAGSITLDDASASGALGINTSALAGEITLSEAVASGSLFIAGMSDLAGTVVLDNASASGGLGTAGAATIVSQEFRSTETRLLLGAATFAHAVLLRVSDRHPAASIPSPTTGSNSRMTITSTGMTAGVDYLLVVWNTDGTLAGVQKVTAA
jgi:hypothetical protein